MLRDERVDEDLEGAGRLLRQLGIGSGPSEEPTEHHPVVRRVGHGEPDVLQPHRFETGTPAAFPLPCVDEGEAQHSEPLARDR